MMEADSTTYDSNSKALLYRPCLPFNVCPGNFKLFTEFVHDSGEKSIESQIFERLQSFGLLPNNAKCPSKTPDCKMICRAARVVDRLQWACEACGKRQPIRDGSFFFRLQCSLPQALEMILAWCEDADCNVAAEHFGVKTKVANQIYNKLDDLAIKEYNRTRLGGPNSVVLAEMYPDCLNRLSPDTTENPHVHRILMLADTNHIPTYYRLHVLREDTKRTNGLNSNQMLITQIENIIAKSVAPDSTLVTGTTLPAIDGAVAIQKLTQHCDADMQQFLRSRIWQQAVTVGGAARALRAAGAAQRYLDAALHRLRYGDGFFHRMLNSIAAEFTNKCT